MRDYPSHWLVGQLLDLKRFNNGTFRATLLGEEWKPELRNAIEFTSGYEAQQFISQWYQQPLARDPIWRDNPMAEVFEPMTPSSHVETFDSANPAPQHVSDGSQV
jgi:hypothetical protein